MLFGSSIDCVADDRSPLFDRQQGGGVVAWCEQPPDFSCRPIDELLRQLPFTIACVLLVARAARPKVVARLSVLKAIGEHVGERPVEMGGLLMGAVHRMSNDANEFVVAVTRSVPSRNDISSPVSLRMATDVWESARLISGDQRSVIGWYHSHPDLGAFFSGTDRRTQRAFFNQPQGLALVVDPVRNEHKWFIGKDSDELSLDEVICHS
jgi:proteasome lid subunit RPN8/RPN11